MLKKHGHTLKEVSWVSQDIEIDSASFRIVQELKSRNTHKKDPALNRKDHERLIRKFKNAAHSKTTSYKFMKSFAEQTEIDPNESGILVLADMKEWERAAEKLKAKDRNTNDLGRGRIYVRTPNQFKAAERILAPASANSGTIKAFDTKGITVVPGSFENYVTAPRKSGFAGFANADLVVPVGKGQQKGIFELQIMPYGYEKTDELSHRLFDMIRILQETPETYKNDGDKKVETALVLANQALWIEAAERLGFIGLRQADIPKIREAGYLESYGILDRIGTEISYLGGRNFAWKSETIEAIREAKTALTNIYLGQNNQFKQTRKPK